MTPVECKNSQHQLVAQAVLEGLLGLARRERRSGTYVVRLTFHEGGLRAADAVKEEKVLLPSVTHYR